MLDKTKYIPADLVISKFIKGADIKVLEKFNTKDCFIVRTQQEGGFIYNTLFNFKKKNSVYITDQYFYQLKSRKV